MNNKSYSRMQRVDGVIHRAVASFLQARLKSPRLGFVTVTRCEVSKDIAYAKIYVSVLNPEKSVEDAIAFLTESSKLIRKEISPELKLRVTPELRFYHDGTADRAARIMELLQEQADKLPPQSDDLS
jgi:ribosome-binding factor A